MAGWGGGGGAEILPVKVRVVVTSHSPDAPPHRHVCSPQISADLLFLLSAFLHNSHLQKLFNQRRPFPLTGLLPSSSPPPQGEKAEGDAGDGAAARQEHERPADVAVAHGGGAGPAAGLQRLPRRRDSEETGRAAGGPRPLHVCAYMT